ncbi:adenylate kinase [Chroococcidiopsis sp. TS-821]|uniref:adenylate kinase n=1 Tax=Chroococcidiopsis sp. TS-821 TaxID=1378066 RepID=UPI000CEDD64A|nr:adenylate kinase [Chroococcidiopsis sp. TS-821]PPS45220.1 adenylate kinase [Chroococcidiopsis sp. TS-821]
MTRLIFLGAPGAGKGTQAQTLAHHRNIPHVSTGDILRQAMQKQTPLGVRAQDYVSRGELVPDQLVNDLVEERLDEPDAQDGWILDGFPRKVSQAFFLDELLQQKQIHQDVRVINLEVPDDVLIARLLGRGRADDNEEVIRRRLEVYREQTAPLIDFYRDRQQLVSVNGNQSLEEVTAELLNVIDS